MCELLFSAWIVGAVEYGPNSMRLELMQPLAHPDEAIEVVHVYTDEYNKCFTNTN